MKKERERVEVLIAREYEEKMIIDNQKKRNERTNSYLQDIKKQMEDQQRRKRDELNWNKMNISTGFVD